MPNLALHSTHGGPPSRIPQSLSTIRRLLCHSMSLPTLFYNFQCSSQFVCDLFSSSNTCSSKCATCGTGCSALRVLDRSNLAHYIDKSCEVIFGDLYLTSIPSITQQELYDAFSRVKTIEGNLIISNNPTMTSLNFLSNLASVRNINIANNDQLVDAMLPNLESYGNITMQSNNRLCSQLFPLSPSSDVSQCARLNVVQLLNINGSASLDDIKHVFASLSTSDAEVCKCFGNLTFNLTNIA